jgi:hypothetical protein
MKEKDNKEGDHCREVREILETPPSWFIRWGTLAIVLVVVIIIIVFWTKFT